MAREGAWAVCVETVCLHVARRAAVYAPRQHLGAHALPQALIKNVVHAFEFGLYSLCGSTLGVVTMPP